MHFGKIVKNVALSKGVCASELAELLGRSEKQVLELYEQREWTSGTIKVASTALKYDFGKYLNSSFKFDFLSEDSDDFNEYIITVKYPKGKEFLLKTWLQKMLLIAKSVGLEVRNQFDK